MEIEVISWSRKNLNIDVNIMLSICCFPQTHLGLLLGHLVLKLKSFAGCTLYVYGVVLLRNNSPANQA